MIPINYKILKFIDEKPSDYDFEMIIIKENHLILLFTSYITFILMFYRLDDLSKLLFILRRLVKANDIEWNQNSSKLIPIITILLLSVQIVFTASFLSIGSAKTDLKSKYFMVKRETDLESNDVEYLIHIVSQFLSSNPVLMLLIVCLFPLSWKFTDKIIL